MNTNVSLSNIFWDLYIELAFGIFSTCLRAIAFGP